MKNEVYPITQIQIHGRIWGTVLVIAAMSLLFWALNPSIEASNVEATPEQMIDKKNYQAENQKTVEKEEESTPLNTIPIKAFVTTTTDIDEVSPGPSPETTDRLEGEQEVKEEVVTAPSPLLKPESAQNSAMVKPITEDKAETLDESLAGATSLEGEQTGSINIEIDWNNDELVLVLLSKQLLYVVYIDPKTSDAPYFVDLGGMQTQGVIKALQDESVVKQMSDLRIMGSQAIKNRFQRLLIQQKKTMIFQPMFQVSVVLEHKLYQLRSTKSVSIEVSLENGQIVIKHAD